MRAFICLGTCLIASATIAQDYEIVERSGRVTAVASIQRGQLLIVESTGERVVFGREPRYDSPDGSMLGFYNVDLRRVLRFPRAGQGAMQVADLDRPDPRFRYTQRSVRPREIDPAIGYVPGYGSGFGATADPYAYAYPYVPSLPYAWGYSAPAPRSVLIESKTVPNPPLEPARLLLANGGPREILVSIVNVTSGESKQLRIAPAEQVAVELQRDAGGKRIGRYQTGSLTGEVITREVVSEIPPTVRYEVTVHEWVMQSIAIDRTGKSPSVIEDINFQGTGLGRFTLPPGDQLRSGTLDVYRTAVSAANRGSVAPIPAQEKELGDGLSPLERAIQDLQRGR